MHSFFNNYFKITSLVIKRFLWSGYKSPHKKCLYIGMIIAGLLSFINICIDSLIVGMHKKTYAAIKGQQADLIVSIPQKYTALEKEKLIDYIKNCDKNNVVTFVGLYQMMVVDKGIVFPGIIFFGDKNLFARYKRSPENLVSEKLVNGLNNNKSLSFYIKKNNQNVSMQFKKYSTFSCNENIILCDAEKYKNVNSKTHILIDCIEIEKMVESIKKFDQKIEYKIWYESFQDIYQAMALEQLCAKIIIVLLILLGLIASGGALIIYLIGITRDIVSLMILGVPKKYITIVTSSVGAITLAGASMAGATWGYFFSVLCDTYHVITLNNTLLQDSYVAFYVVKEHIYFLIGFHMLAGIVLGYFYARKLNINSLYKTYQEHC